MTLEGKAKRVRIYVHEGDLIGHTAAHVALVQFLHREGASGASVFRAMEGFGATGIVHTNRLVDIFQQLPIVVEWVDSPERVERLLGPIKQMVVRGLITVEETAVVLYAPHPLRRISNQVTVEEVMSRDVARVMRQDPVRKVVELLLGRIYRAVPVIEEDRVVGIITNSDLVMRGGLGARMELMPSLDTPQLQAALEPLTQGQKTAGEIMTPSPLTAHPSMALTQVADLMVHRRVKRLPVVDDQQRLVGMISRLDLLRTVAEGFQSPENEPREIGLNGEVSISRVMRREVPTVHPDTPIGEVLPAIFSTRLNRAVVVDRERRVVGIVTDAELLERMTPSLRPSALHSLLHRLPFVHHAPEQLLTEQHAKARTAGELMRIEIPTVLEQTPLREALPLMLRGKEKLIAVVDSQSRLVGLVDRADILRGLADRTS